MPFQAVATQRLYEQVAGQVTDLVARGEFKPGDRLPPERDLAKLLGVSRPTVREAMIALEIAGLVEVRVGAGAFVTDKARERRRDRRLFEGVGSSPLELIAARRTIEPEVAALAAQLATPDEIAAIAETVAMIARRAGHAVASRRRSPVPRPHRACEPQQHPHHHRGRVLGRDVLADVRAHGRDHRPDRHALQPAAARHDRRRARGGLSRHRGA